MSYLQRWGAQEKRNSAQPAHCLSCCFLVLLIVAPSVRVGWRNVLQDTLHCPRVIFTSPLGCGGLPFPSVLCGLPLSTWVELLVALPRWRMAPWGA